MMYTTPMSPEPLRALFFGQLLISNRKYILQITQPSQYWYTRGTLVWQVWEEGRLSTCQLYVYIIYRVLLCGAMVLLLDGNSEHVAHV